jgi:hypothetical protein
MPHGIKGAWLWPRRAPSLYWPMEIDMTFTQDELQEIAVRYLPREGGFASALADAYLKADLTNQRRIEGAFGDLFTTAYRKWATQGETA